MDDTQHSPPGTRAAEIADDLRRRIRDGEFPVGENLPTFDELRARYSAGGGTVKEAVDILKVEGLVYSARRLGTVVLEQGRQQRFRLDRGHSVRRNEFGYIFNSGAGHWAPIAYRKPTWTHADDEVAARLELEPGSPVLQRWRVVGPDKDHPYQLTATYLIEAVARDTVLEQENTGPGGWMDRIEHDLGHGPLGWYETASTRFPTAEEAKALRMAKNAPALVLARVATSGKINAPVGVDITVVAGHLFEVGYGITRDRSARWPTTPAASRNQPR